MVVKMNRIKQSAGLKGQLSGCQPALMGQPGQPGAAEADNGWKRPHSRGTVWTFFQNELHFLLCANCSTFLC